MEQENQAGGPARRGVATSRVEAAVALVLLAFGIVVLFESRRLGVGWSTDGPGAGYFPFIIGVILSVSSVGMLYQALFGRNRKETIFVDSEQLKRVLSVLLPATAYVVLIVFLGMYIASAVYIALFMIVLGKYPWPRSSVAAIVITTLFFFMFEVWFKVPLFKGSLDPLRFLGY